MGSYSYGYRGMEVDGGPADELRGGIVPREIGDLSNLRVISLGGNNLRGTIPATIFNISTLQDLFVASNQLSGTLPLYVSHQLANLESLHLGGNSFTGILPEPISNATKLTRIDLAKNNFSGRVPNSLGNLGLLEIFQLAGNDFINTFPEFSFITSLTNCTKLRVLRIGYNPLTGPLPASIGNLSASLQDFYASGCRIRGTIPSEISNLSGLVSLALYENDLIGSIPNTIKGLQKLQRLDVGRNKLRGSIPDDLCQLPNLGGLWLPANQLSGSLPTCLWNISSLRYLYLGSNKLTSTIPASLGNLKDLLTFSASFNSLQGNLPSKIGNLKAVMILDLSYNNFSGNIPGNIGDLQNLAILYLEHNDLTGTIPETFESLVSLETLDLSQNNLLGVIPKSLEKLLQLKFLNVSYNKLHGEIPSGGPFEKFASQSFLPNEDLCGATQFGVRPCKTNSVSRLKTLRKLVIICVSSTISLIVLLLTFVLLWIRCQKSKRLPVEIDLQPVAVHRRITQQEILEATNGFEESKLLGNGSFGSVYKGVLSDGMVVAIKVFKLQQERALKSFHVECEVIRNVRHRNLIKIVTSCSNPDFKALILEYMPNGSLEKWLYSHSYVLDIMQRLDIMIDLACALDYLHHEYGLGGSISTSCDVYSYGIMLMETFTRKKPTDEMFAGQMSLKIWVKELLPSAVIQVLDKNLLRRDGKSSLAEVDCLLSILKLALDCAAESPEQRINMKDVLATLKKIKVVIIKYHLLVDSSWSIPVVNNIYQYEELDLPSFIGQTQPNLEQLLLGGNEFTGSLPVSIASASKLYKTDVISNHFTDVSSVQLFGPVPTCLANVTSLRYLYLGYNKLNSSMPESFRNSLGGFLPSDGGPQNLVEFSLAYNRLEGPIPDTLESLASLEILDLSHNNLPGMIP
ncbi:hypothetical protein RJ640_027936 [Escallonia rubra]|uniref:Protein kinase domain-containing protein n=1 Tax=Escallonia rubra TaxID=112253 RepID=A0AA88UKY8_9ASTE|nr:hypothetical protein RJ640_027936 [Escallonia rubra]